VQLVNGMSKVIISGGGTGGHIFPALAIAHALKKINPDTEILFVGAEGKMEMEKVPAAGYKIIGLPIAGIKRRLSIDNLFFPVKLLKSLSKANSILKSFKPDIAIGVGGYASGPMLFAASLNGVPTLIQEQNSYPGITNKILSKKATKICVAYEGMDQFFQSSKIMFTGNPVGEDIKDLNNKKSIAATHFQLSESIPTLLIVGGSQGARSINKAIFAGLEILNNAGVQVVWQTGKTFFAEADEKIKQSGFERIKAFDFISKMDLAYALCDVVVARAGASTVSELCIVKKPSILVPLPTAAEDHQTKNCLALVNRNAALLVKDQDASANLVSEAVSLLNNSSKQKELANNIAPLARPDAADTIAKEIFSIINKK
jgi:UDP-N-acetylglucosamine--N-acetylmuramyl-(pentapeptide) pyrophosphoryl-undecaprenol N-acetylglucosamine transferase